jgi:hypothetical protein
MDVQDTPAQKFILPDMLVQERASRSLVAQIG